MTVATYSYIHAMHSRGIGRSHNSLGHDIRADCEIASGCGFTTCAYALIENDVIDYSRGLSRGTL